VLAHRATAATLVAAFLRIQGLEIPEVAQVTKIAKVTEITHIALGKLLVEELHVPGVNLGLVGELLETLGDPTATGPESCEAASHGGLGRYRPASDILTNWNFTHGQNPPDVIVNAALV
jgi:hypothetical protein